MRLHRVEVTDSFRNAITQGRSDQTVLGMQLNRVEVTRQFMNATTQGGSDQAVL